MNIVYKITFEDRLKNKTPPYYYIGSKSNCEFENGKILDSRNKEYWGSSKWPNYNEIVKNDRCSIEIIEIFDNYRDAIEFEYKMHLINDVVADIEYFNLSNASVNNFSDPNYATFKHAVFEEIVVRLPRDHPKIIDGTYVGVSKNSKLSPETKKKISRSGSENPFYGKKHSEETKQKISKKNKGRVKSQEEIDNWVEKVAKKPMTDAHKKILSETNRNMIMLKHVTSGEAIKIHSSEKHKYDPVIWLNPAKINQKRLVCRYCGIESTAGNIKRWHNENCKESK